VPDRNVAHRSISGVVNAADLPGEFIIRNYVKNAPLSAHDARVDEPDAVVTTATSIGPSQRFKLNSVPLNYTTIQTPGGRYLTASADIRPGNGDPRMALQTYDTMGVGTSHFKATAAFHTDALKASTWERYWILKCAPDMPEQSWLLAHVGEQWNMHVYFAFYPTHFKFMRQSDGSYALALPSRNQTNYITAVAGGGLASGDNLHTDATQVKANLAPSIWLQRQVRAGHDRRVATESAVEAGQGSAAGGRPIASRSA
jgi:hypothetical protein